MWLVPGREGWALLTKLQQLHSTPRAGFGLGSSPNGSEVKSFTSVSTLTMGAGSAMAVSGKPRKKSSSGNISHFLCQTEFLTDGAGTSPQFSDAGQ